MSKSSANFLNQRETEQLNQRPQPKIFNMKNKLSFDLEMKEKVIHVEFETESFWQNKITKLSINRYELVVDGLRKSHPLLFGAIEKQMTETAETFWDNEQDTKEAFNKLPSFSMVDYASKLLNPA